MKKKELIDLLGKMTLEEKVGQLVQIAGGVFLTDDVDISTGPFKDLNLSNEMLYNVGSILNIVGSKKIRKIQDKYLSKSRLKIPLLFMADIINGYRTVLPIPIAQGCSWDLDVIYNSTKLSIKEASAAGTSVNFSPMVDLVRDSRWGRVMESIGGEDPYLGEIYAKTTVEAYQGDDISKLGNSASCVKHFAAYGAAEAGRDYNTVDMSEREFRQYYLPAYKSAIENGVEMIMTSFNTVNGIPVSVNKWLLRDLLRKELGFKGVVISDYSAIEETIAHGVSKDRKEAAYKAIMAGVDIDMMSSVYANNLKELVEEGRVPEKILDESVLRVLELKNKLGLFENPYGNIDEEREERILKSKENLCEARKLTAETLVLLKNDEQVLPLKKNSSKIALIGPYADNIAILGSWSMFSDKSKITTLKEAFENKIGRENILYSKFEYSELNLSSNQIKDDTKIIVTVKVKNNSSVPGKEAIQLYIQDLVASVVRPVKELKLFRKEFFGAFEEKVINFEINTDMLKFWNESLEYTLEKGGFKVFVGPNSKDTLEALFEYI